MPRIPVISIPNAPRAAGVAPVQTSTISRSEVAGTLHNVAKAGQRESMRLDAFSGEQRGMQAMAQGVADVGNVATKILFAELDAKNDAAVNEASLGMAKDYAAFMARQPDAVDGDTLRTEWQKEVGEIQKRYISDQKLSPEAKARINEEYSRFATRQTITVDNAARSITIDRARKSDQAMIDWCIQSENWDQGAKRIDEMVAKGRLFPEQAEEKKKDLNRMQEFKSYSKLAQRDPDAVNEMLDNLEKGGKTTLFPQDQQKLREEATQSKINIRRSAIEDCNNLIDSGVPFDSEELSTMYPDMTETDLAAAKRRIANSSQPPEFSFKDFSEARSVVNNYNADDDKSREKYFQIQGMINSLPADPSDKRISLIREELADKMEVKKKKIGYIEGEVKTEVFNRLDALVEKHNIFGTIEMKDKKPTNSQHNQEIYKKKLEVQEKFKEWSKSPDAEGASYLEANNWLNAQVQSIKPVGTNKKGLFDKVIDYLMFNDEPSSLAPIPTDQEIQSKADEFSAREKALKGKTSSIPNNAVIGVVTDYGQKDDPTPDSASLGIGKYKHPTGAWDNKLSEDSLAISRDIEAKFKEAGIKEGDKVKLTLADGTEVIKQWDDRTAEEYNGKKLTGRFDFYSPKGKHDKRDVKVVGFEKV